MVVSVSSSFALRERHRAREVGDVLAVTRAWKLFGLIPMMLLHRPRGSGSVGRDERCKRADHRTPPLPGVDRTDEEERTQRGVVAQELQGQVSRARQVLTGAALAPKTWETLEELRRKRCQSQVQPIPLDVMEFTPDTCRIGRKSVCHVTSECAQRIRCRPWRVHLRNASGVSRRC